MPHREVLKLALKRGALIAAANWQVTLIQATADSLFKLLIAAPVIGGGFLVALVVGAEPDELVMREWREMVAVIVTALVAHPTVLTAFLFSVSVVIVGGSLLVFLIKGGTVSVLTLGDRRAGPLEKPPLQTDMVAGAAVFSIDFYIDSARALFPRYARLGFVLMAVYAASACAYLLLFMSTGGGEGSWGIAALLTVAFVVWITLINLGYLLVQIVIAADACSVRSAARRVIAFLRHAGRDVAGVFLVVLVLVIGATGASVLATAALGLIAFVPFVGLTVLPLQLLAWLLRGIVFQYISLSSVGAYLNLYRSFSGDPVATRARTDSVGQPVMGHTG
jgi:hypothetical protein